ncbi:MAG: alpha/beta hydrolase [Gammaproteobacteria bacterium]
MPLNAASQLVLNLLASQGLRSFDALEPSVGRPYFNALFATRPEDRVPLARVEALSIPVTGGALRARLYAATTATPLPVLVHYHGGGWVYMDLEAHDGYCRLLAQRSDCAVLAVEYRKAPEHPFPVPFEDCVAALAWTHANAGVLGLDATRCGVVGDSAGGNLAAAVALAARDAGGPPLRAQVLTYPAVDATMNQPSMAENEYAPLLGRAQMDWFWSHYNRNGVNVLDQRLSPLHAARHDGLPPTLIATAEYDPLRDEGEAYAQALAAAGTLVECVRYEGVFHGFMLLHKLVPEGARLIARQVDFVRHHVV